MPRTEGDTWNLASSVGATATMVAAGRAMASRDARGLINDPFAAPLVRAVGIEFFTKMIDDELDLSQLEGGSPERVQAMIGAMAVRTKFFDDYFSTATGGGDSALATGGGDSALATGGGDSALATGGGDSTATGGGDSSKTVGTGIRQAVILASGLDSRAYRLPWPTGTVVYEIDQPAVIEFKSTTLARIGATPTAERRAVPIDLRDDWPAALRAAGFDTTVPTAWCAEGLLIYLPPEAQDRLFDDITGLSVPGSTVATEYVPGIMDFDDAKAREMSAPLRDHGLDIDMPSLVYAGDRSHVTEYLRGSDWTITSTPSTELFLRNGLTVPPPEYNGPLGEIEYVGGTLTAC